MGKRKIVAFDVDDTLVLLGNIEDRQGQEPLIEDKIKNPHKLLPLMLFMGNSPDIEMGMLTNRSAKKDELRTATAQQWQTRLNEFGINIDDRFVIRSPIEFDAWTTNARTEFEQDLYLKEDSEYPNLKAEKQQLQKKLQANENKLKTYMAVNPRPYTNAVHQTILGYEDISKDLTRQLQVVDKKIMDKQKARAQSLDKNARDTIEAEIRTKYSGKNIRLEQIRQRANIKHGTSTDVADTIMVDDSQHIIDGTKNAGYDSVKATDPGKENNNSDYVQLLGQKVGADNYLSDLLIHPENHRNDPPMQVAGALMYGIQTRDDFKPKFSDYLKNMTYSEKQQITAMIQYIQENRPDYENDKDFKALAKALPSDKAAKKNEQMRNEQNKQFLDKVQVNFNRLIYEHDRAPKENQAKIKMAMEAIRDQVRVLLKDNDPDIRMAAKVVAEKIFDHKAVTESHLKQLAKMQQAFGDKGLSKAQVDLLENTLTKSVNADVRNTAKEVLENHKHLNNPDVQKLWAEYENYKAGRMNPSQQTKFIDKVEFMSAISSFRTVTAAIKSDMEFAKLGPYEHAAKNFIATLARTIKTAPAGDPSIALYQQFMTATDLSKIESVKNQLISLAASLDKVLQQGSSTIAELMQKAIADFKSEIKKIEEPKASLPPQKPGARPLPISPSIMVVDALNKQTKPGWEHRQVTDRGLQSSQLFSAKMTKGDAEKLLTSLHKDLHARVIESTSDKSDTRFRVALDTKDGAALLQRHAPLSFPPAHRPLPVIPQATSQATRSSSTTAKPDEPPQLKKDDSKRRTGPGTSS